LSEFYEFCVGSNLSYTFDGALLGHLKDASVKIQRVHQQKMSLIRHTSGVLKTQQPK